MSVHNPLDEAEMSLLDSFLLSPACADDALAIDEAHGLLTALSLCPGQLGEGWHTEVWGEAEFESPAQQAHIADLLDRLAADVKAALAKRGPFEPLVVEIEEEDGDLLEAYEGWCYGFMLGVAMYQEAWDGLAKEQEALLLPIASLAMLSDEEEPPEMSDEEYDDWVELLPGAVRGLHDWWQAHPYSH